MLILENFSKSYNHTPVIQNTNIKIGAKNISFLMGPNGCGKTTLLKCIAGLEDYKGKIFYDEAPIEKVRNDAYIIWDDCPFYNELSGLDNLMILTENANVKKNEIYEISNKYFNKEILLRKVKTYSYGQRKKLALILNGLIKPKILIMDEISNGLDYDTMRLLQSEVKRISAKVNVLLTGHQFSFYEGIVEEVFIFINNTIKDVTDEYKAQKSLSTIYERYYYNE